LKYFSRLVINKYMLKVISNSLATVGKESLSYEWKILFLSIFKNFLCQCIYFQPAFCPCCLRERLPSKCACGLEHSVKPAVA